MAEGYSSRLDRLAEVDAQIVRLLRSPEWPEQDKELLRILASHRGAGNPISALSLAEQMRFGEGEAARRKVTGTIEDLIVRGRIPIGARRSKPNGYFLIVDHADLGAAEHALWGEIYALLRRLRVLSSRERVAELFGQAMLDFDSPTRPPGGSVTAEDAGAQRGAA